MKTNSNSKQLDPVQLDGRFSHVNTEILAHWLRYEVVMMTPPLAERLLGKLHPNQRSAKPAKIETFMADMKAGRWRLNPHPVIIDEDGWLCDGLNRLTACVRCLCAVPMVLCYGAPRTSMVVYDTGTCRNVNDAARVDGKPLSHPSAAGVVRAMAASVGGKCNLSVQQIMDWASTYRAGIGYAFERRGEEKVMPGLFTACTRAVLARAYYSAARTRLDAFAEQLATGLVDSKKTDSAVIMIRNWLLTAAKGREAQTSKATRKQTYLLTEFVLSEYLESRRPAQLMEVFEEQFPLPDLEAFDRRK